MITNVSGEMYRYVLVSQNSADGTWMKTSGTEVSGEIRMVEETFPNRIGYINPDSLALWTGGSGPGELEILTHHLETEDYWSQTVVGTAWNAGEDRILGVMVEATFYDWDGKVLGRSFDYIYDLEPRRNLDLQHHLL